MAKNFQKEIQWILKDKYKGHWRPKIINDINRLKKGGPVDYIIGWKPFLNCRIDLSQKPLIPRIETEYWVEKAIEEIKAERGGKNKFYALDIFSGSGCIGIALLKNFPQAEVDFSDNNKKFLKQIKINLKINGIKPRRYKLIKSDVFSKIGKKYNYIFANPPYVSFDQKVQKSVLKYEPKSALFAAENGLFFIKKFLKEAKNYLNPDGKIYMEFGLGQKKKIGDILCRNGNKNQRFFKDQFNRWRWLSMGLTPLETL